MDIESIKSLLDDTASVTDSFIEAVLMRLESFGVNVTEDDTFMIAFSIRYAHNTIFNFCNIKTLPDGLYNIAVDMACGEYLNTLKGMCRLNLNGVDLNGAISQIKEGDTTVSFDASTSDEQKLTAFINHLLHGRKGDLVCYRKFKW